MHEAACAAQHHFGSSATLLPAVEARMLGLLKTPKAGHPLLLDSAQQAAAYHLNSGGQRIRARIAAHACGALGVSPGDAVSVAAAAELIHNASLIHDDLQDRDQARRGIDSVWVVFGDGVAICAGDLLLSAAYAAICGISRPHLLPSLIAVMHGSVSSACVGQSVDLAEGPQAPLSLADYEQLAILKSGSLLSLPLELSLVIAGQQQALPDAQKIANSFAIAYQIFDDLNDVQKDAARQPLRPAINVVAIARAQHLGEDAVSLVKQLALRHLDQAAEVSARLANNCGEFLRSLALDLRARIASQSQ
jgi:geranylgeranyl pyrophosphate synthase